MIVNINSQNRENYNKLFIESYKYLVDEGKITAVDGKDGFSSLPEYYSHMNDFFTTGGYKYIFLPLNEIEFNIDLNKRSITVPSDFSKLVSVQSDKLAETIIFSVDRYFDYMDLANTNIYVQWKTPDMGKDDEGHATRIYMIDLSTPDKIRFAWPISDALTHTPGVVKFSVRFFRISSEENMVYSLNTLESSFNIAAAHQATLNDKANVEYQEGLFENVIINSMYADEGISLPQSPEFLGGEVTIYKRKVESDNPVLSTELSAVTEANLDANLDVLTLYAEASAIDNGEFSYEWYYISNAEKAEPQLLANGADYTISSAYVAYTTSHTDAEGKPDWSIGYIPGQRYYTLGEDGLSYSRVADVPASKENTLYRRFSTLKINNTNAEVVGTYYAKAYNTISPNTNPNPATTSDCVLPAPGVVVIKEDGNLSATGNFIQNGKCELSVEHDEDKQNTVDVIQYNWKKVEYVEGKPVVSTESEGTSKVLTITTPGYYQVELSAFANRKTSEKTVSNIAKVTNPPAAPEFKFVDADGKEITFNYENYQYQLSQLKDDTSFVIALKESVTENPYSLTSEKVTYKWYFQELNALPNEDGKMEWTLLSNETNTLEIRKEESDKIVTAAPGIYAPVAINHLNGSVAENNPEDTEGKREIFISVF